MFRRQCFVAGKSFFWPDLFVWTDDSIASVVDLLENFPKGSEVLQRLSETIDDRAKQARLLTELVVLYYLFPFKISRNTKVANLEAFAERVGVQLPADEPWADCFEQGIGNTGIHYQTSLIRQILFFAKFAQTLRRLGTNIDESSAVNDSAIEALTLAPGAPEARSAILHLFFPDFFEPIVSNADKRDIVEQWNSYATLGRDLDEKLRSIRTTLETEYARGISFYEHEIQRQWDPDFQAGAESTDAEIVELPNDLQRSLESRKVWVEKTNVTNRIDRQAGEFAVGRALWSPKTAKGGRDYYWAMREVRPGDIILHLTDKEAITGYSIARTSAEDFHGVAGTEWAGVPALLVLLGDHVIFDLPIAKEDWQREPYAARLRAISATEKNLFYRSDLHLVQGGYLTPCPMVLVMVIADIYGQLTSGRQLFAELSPPTATTPSEQSARYARLRSETLWSDERLNELIDLLKTPGVQVILAGPPGTSKTRVMRAAISYLTHDDDKRVKFVQFHPSYSYEQFIEGVRPQTGDGGILKFEPYPGVVLQFIETMHGDDSYYVLIDEINRANLARVFGELLVLFEYRNEPISLSYSGKFSLPDNLHFVGTMNTADRSIRSIDTAFRRRFDIIECFPDGEMLEKYYSNRKNDVGGLREGFERLNGQLVKVLGRHYQIGHAFFMRPEMTHTVLNAIWRRKVFPLIEEYFFDQPERLEGFVFESFWPSVR